MSQQNLLALVGSFFFSFFFWANYGQCIWVGSSQKKTTPSDGFSTIIDIKRPISQRLLSGSLGWVYQFLGASGAAWHHRIVCQAGPYGRLSTPGNATIRIADVGVHTRINEQYIDLAMHFRKANLSKLFCRWVSPSHSGSGIVYQWCLCRATPRLIASDLIMFCHGGVCQNDDLR